jgi:Enoyl-(Acyl carrier protein) reductase
MTIVLAPQGQTFNAAQQVKGSGQGDSPMGAEFDGKKVNVVGGNSGMGQPAARRHRSRWQTFAPLQPPGRVGTPTDAAKAITSLLTDQSSWITGTILKVDGGIMAGRN